MLNEILVVDDDPSTIVMMKRLLMRAGYQVTTAQNGQEALALLGQKTFSVVLTDWEMPELDGPTLCRAIRRGDFNSYVYTILLTARTGRDQLLEGLDAGADDYLTKPVDEAELIARLKTAQRMLRLEKRLRDANEAAVRMATIDALTSAYNRRHLMSEFPCELERARRYATPISVVMCDVDHFKTINDRYGHQAGDAVLKQVAETLMATCRPKVDWVARYGGEEFVIVLPHTPLSGALIAAERMRHALEALVVESDRHTLQVTASFGVAADQRHWPTPLLAAERMLGQADECLYLSKRGGRNRVMPSMEPEDSAAEALEQSAIRRLAG